MATRTERPIHIADRLKQARESKGLSHRQIADVTKLSTQVIRALEEGRVASLPSGIYRRALVRTVALEVGLDPETTVRAFFDEYPSASQAKDRPEAAAQAKPVRVTWRRALGALGAVVPLVVGVAYFGSASGRRGPDALPALAAARDASTWRPEIVPAGGFSEAPPPAARPVAMLITLSARCQLRVVADGGLLVDRTFEAGESLQVAFGDAVELSGNNAGAVQFSLNGRAGRLLGEPGEPLSARIGRDDYTFFLVSR